MSTLETLADEIILEVLRHLEVDNLTLSRLCCTSSRLHSLARPVLYKHIHLNHNQPNFPPNESLVQLARSINRDPDLASLVRCLDLNWPKGGYIPPDNKIEIKQLLQKLASFHRLSVRAPRDQQSTFSFLEFAEYCELRDVVFDYPDLTNATIMRFMFLPKLRMMDIMFLKSLSDPTVPLGYRPGTASLKAIRFGNCTPREDVLRTFLECPAALETLEFSVPPHAEQFQTSTPTRVFSPRQIGEAMLPAKFSLVRLNIHGR